MKNEVLDVIKSRRSVRVYKEEQISDEVIDAVVEAGQYAPNGGGEEQWHFTVVQNRELLEKINDQAKSFAVSSQISWLVSLGEDANFHCMYHAPTVVFVSGDSGNICAVSDTAAATENIMLAAQSLGVGSCWGYFATQAFLGSEGVKLTAELKIPVGYKVYTSVMLGYSAEELQAKPRKDGCVTIIK